MRHVLILTMIYANEHIHLSRTRLGWLGKGLWINSEQMFHRLTGFYLWGASEWNHPNLFFMTPKNKSICFNCNWINFLNFYDLYDMTPWCFIVILIMILILFLLLAKELRNIELELANIEHSYQAEYLDENSKKWGGGSKSGKHQPPQTIENPWLMNSSSSNIRSYCSSFGE